MRTPRESFTFSGLTLNLIKRTKPDENYVLSTLPSGLMGQDMWFDQGAIADSILRIGFKSIHSRTMDTPAGIMDLDLGKKAK